MASGQRQKTTSLKGLLLKHKSRLDISELDQLMALALHKNIEYVYKNPDKKLSRSNILTFKKLLAQRLSGFSLARLKGYKEFYGLNFLVNRHTLIPRPDSELLVTEALKVTKNKQNILDIGTGSGCLILSIAKHNKHSATYWAADISGQALKIAATNARKLGLKNTLPTGRQEIKFVKTDLLKNISKKFDIIIANLPYLKPEQMIEPTISKEPITALLSGKDGLDHYRKLLKQIPGHLNKDYAVFLEIDPEQKDLIKKEISNNLQKAKIKFLKDLAGNARVVRITNKIDK